MRLNDVSSVTLFYWHMASGRVLGSTVVDATGQGLVVHLFASRTTGGECSIIILGLDPRDGASRTYAEVPLGDDPDALRAWEHLRLQGVIEQAKAALGRADHVLRGISEGCAVAMDRPRKGS